MSEAEMSLLCHLNANIRYNLPIFPTSVIVYFEQQTENDEYHQSMFFDVM